MSKGILIAVDGLDGSGKETQSKLLCATLNKAGVKNKLISFPTYKEDSSALIKMYLRGDFGKDPASVNPFAASSFYAMDRYCSYMLDFKKDYDNGTVIIANRYTTANLVHQMSKLSEGEWDSFGKWLLDYEFSLLGLPAPDGVIYLCLPPKSSSDLVQKRCDDTGAVKDIHENNIKHLEDSYKAALYASDKYGWNRVDCVRDEALRSIEDIHGEVCDIVKGILADKGIQF